MKPATPLGRVLCSYKGNLCKLCLDKSGRTESLAAPGSDLFRAIPTSI